MEGCGRVRVKVERELVPPTELESQPREKGRGSKLKTKRGKKIYARRKANVEPLFGQIRTRQGKHVLLRGIEKASHKLKLLAAGHNLMKLHSHRQAVTT